jgi:formate/nitrite transporter FocA (FNT family)
MCNALVCLVVWLCYGARSTIDRIVAIIPPVTAFVAAGFEHSVANMYFIPMGLFVKVVAPDSFWAAILVGAVYWFVYLRRGRRPAAAAPPATGLSSEVER